MKVVIAIDSFKGSLTSLEAAEAIKSGILLKDSNTDVVIKPLADGGEGTVDALVKGMNGTFHEVEVTGPIGSKVKATYGILGDNTTAIIEMAQSSGLPLVPNEFRNPLNTTTYGVGEMIKCAIDKGCRRFIIGIGGSATNDGGLGMLQALGFQFFDENNNLVGNSGDQLNKIKRISVENRLEELEECSFKIACDVSNPLYGENGAAYVFGPQKGATPEIVVQLDNGLRNYADVVKDSLGKDIANIPGAGAAGGLGGGFLGFLNSELLSGIKIILDEIKLEEDIKDADLVITGEGRLDFQTAMGKAPIGVTNLANKFDVPVIALAGATTSDAIKTNDYGILAFFSIANGAMSLEEAMNKETAEENLKITAAQVFNIVKYLKK